MGPQQFWSDDGNYMAYTESTSGSDWKTIYVKDARTGKNTEDELMWIKFSGVSWTNDNKGFFYSRYDVPKNYVAKEKKKQKDGD